MQSLHRRRRTEAAIGLPKPKRQAPRILNSHNQHALTGWVRCGCCGGPKSLANKTRYICSTNRYAHQCSNSRGTKEPDLLAAVFGALRERLRSGPNFRDSFAKAYASEIQAQASLQAQEAAVKAKIDRLMDALEQGIDREHVTERILALQDELDQIRDRIGNGTLPVLPDEATIRETLLRGIDNLERTADDIERQRVAYGHLLTAITLTPVSGQRSGETIKITLRENGWPDFWRMIADGTTAVKR